MSTIFIPALSTVLLGGWVVVPALFPQAMPLLVVGSIFFAWTKYTETIVADRGNMPSLSQCYYKAVFGCCLRSKRLGDAVKVPPISSEAADIVFSIKTLYDYDNLVAPWAAAAVAAAEDEEQKPQPSRSADAPAPPPMTPEMRAVVAMARSGARAFNPAFYTLPAFNMDASIMVFSAFPLRASDAQLVRCDLTVLRALPRKAKLSFSSRVCNHVERDGDVELDFVTEISVDTDSVAAAPAAPAAEAPAPRRPASKRGGPVPLKLRPMAAVGRVVNTYRFPAAAPRVRTDSEGVLSRALISVPAPAAAATAGSLAQTQTLDLSESAPTRFANASGNVNPRHLSPWVERLLGGDTGGSVVDPFQIVAAVIAAAGAAIEGEALVSGGTRSVSVTGGLDGSRPFRLVAEVEQLVQAPVTWTLRTLPPLAGGAAAAAAAAEALGSAVVADADTGADGAAPEGAGAGRAPLRFSLGSVTEARPVEAEVDMDGAVRCIKAILLLGEAPAAAAAAEAVDEAN
jgi:hypothetical protein